MVELRVFITLTYEFGTTKMVFDQMRKLAIYPRVGDTLIVLDHEVLVEKVIVTKEVVVYLAPIVFDNLRERSEFWASMVSDQLDSGF